MGLEAVGGFWGRGLRNSLIRRVILHIFRSLGGKLQRSECQGCVRVITLGCSFEEARVIGLSFLCEFSAP